MICYCWLWTGEKNTATESRSCTCDGVTRSYRLRANSNGTTLLFRRNSGEYPASMLKLYIHDVDAALNTLHHTKWYRLFTKYSQAFGRCSESFRRTSNPNSWHFCVSRSFRICIRCSIISISVNDNDRDIVSSPNS